MLFPLPFFKMLQRPGNRVRTNRLAGIGIHSPLAQRMETLQTYFTFISHTLLVFSSTESGRLQHSSPLFVRRRHPKIDLRQGHRSIFEMDKLLDSENSVFFDSSWR